MNTQIDQTGIDPASEVANEKPPSRVCVVKLALGRCMTAPKKRMAADLHEASAMQNVAANAMVRYWERWCEDNLGEQTQVHIKGKRGPNGEPPRPRNINIRVITVPQYYQLPKGFTTELYHIGKAVSPLLSADVIASTSQRVLKHINKAAPYGSGYKRIWQGILSNRAARPCFRSAELFVPNAKVVANDEGYTVTFPVWSREVRRKCKSHTCRLNSRRLPAGYRRMLLNVSTGVWKVRDSALHYQLPKSRRGRGRWMLHLAYDRLQEPIAGLDRNRVAKLSLCGKKDEKPFEIVSEGSFPRKLGDVRTYEGVYARLDARRMEMRHRHRDKGSRRGHGRQRVEYAIRPVTRKIQELVRRFQWRIVAMIVDYCRRYGCGAVEFAEPSQFKKAKSWFQDKDRQWTWSHFMSRLEFGLWRRGIELKKPAKAKKTA